MSALLYLPGLLVILFKRHGLMLTMRLLLVVAVTQFVLARSFLAEDPRAYLQNAFDLSRVFMYKWTVNWRFLDEETFLSRSWARGLLVGHVTALVAFGLFRWCRSDGGVAVVLRKGFRHPMLPPMLSPVSADCKVIPPPLSVPAHWCRRCCHSAYDVQSDRGPLCSVVALPILFLVLPTSSILGATDKIPTFPAVSIPLGFDAGPFLCI